MKITNRVSFIVLVLLAPALISAAPNNQSPDPSPPDRTVKLIFIHHSTGENWLTDGYGDLGMTLDQNNYFVSDTNYGWGPNAIGDRTDIPNWTEWFASGDTPVYMDALFNESGQNAGYTRTLADPGGENEIVMFKSCFPNSALEGNPNDPPGTYEELSVSGAKYVYNTILPYFATRPDKLFIVITAPPLSDDTYAENARAFNDWLLNDWLDENNYTLNNVAVFDFYNVLTDPGAHHRFDNGGIEHIAAGSNTLYYPSEDDHPSVEGSRKATEEFAPMLNYFYHRWQAQGPFTPPEIGEIEPPAGESLSEGQSPSGTVGLLDDFEGKPPAGTAGWEGFFQDGADTQLICELDNTNAHAGSSSLQFQFDAAANSWATCGFYFDTVQDWSAGQGVSFHMQADRSDLPLDITVYSGSPGGRSTYIHYMDTSGVDRSDWTLVEIAWADILRAEWEETPGSPVDPHEVTGFSIGFSTPETQRVAGNIWLDDLSLIGLPVEAPPTSAAEEPSSGVNLPCVGSLMLSLILFGMVVLRR